MSDPKPPEPFTLHTRVSPMTEPWAPIYRWDQADRVYLGVVLREVHCNSRGLVHGGFIAALSDNTMGYTAGQAMAATGRRIRGLVTVNLAVDYLGAAQLGQWMTWEPELIKAGGTLAFVRAEVRADGDSVARANATFKIMQ